jgi:hypothetical protein
MICTFTLCSLNCVSHNAHLVISRDLNKLVRDFQFEFSIALRH